MKSLYKTLFLLAIGVSLLACAPPETETPPAEPEPAESAAPETGPDPTLVDSDHYKVEFENEHVRIIRITYGPGETSAMHYHPDHAGVFLTDLDVTFELPDGSSEEVHAKANEHIFMPAGQHLPTNIGDQAFEGIAVELKSGTPEVAAEPAAESGPDPTEMAADHYKAEFENDRVRLVRITYGPGEETPMHYHPACVAVFLTDQHVSLERPDGTVEEIVAKAGDHRFLPAGQHLPRNLAEAPFELVLVELKGL